MMYCRQCGKQLNDDAKFCTGCGQKVEPIATKQENVVSQPIQQVTQKRPLTAPVNPISVDISTTNQFNNTKTTSHKKKKPKPIAMVAVMLACLLLFTMIFGSGNKTAKLAKFEPINLQDNAPTIGDLMVASPYYYVNNEIDTGLNEDYAKYMSVLIADSVEATELLMDKYYTNKKEIDRLQNLVIETAEMCDNDFGTKYMSEIDLIDEVFQLHSGCSLNADTYEQCDIKEYENNMEFASIVGIKMHTAIMAGRCLSEEFLLLSSMSATLVNNHVLNASGQTRDNLMEIQKIVANNKLYENFSYMAACSDSLDELLKYKEAADVEVAIDNLEGVLYEEAYIIRDIQTLQRSGKYSDDEIKELMISNGLAIGMAKAFLPILQESLTNVQLKNDYSYEAMNDFSLMTKAYASNSSNFGKSIDVQKSAQAASKSTMGSSIWSAISSAAGATWDATKTTVKYGKAGIAAGFQVCGDVSYAAARGATALYYWNDYEDFKGDINDRVAESYKRYGSVESIGAIEIKAVADSMKYISDKGTEFGKSVGSVLDDGVVELTKMTTGGVPKARIFTAIGAAAGNVISGAVTTGANSVATIANQKSSTGDMAKAVFDLGLMYYGNRGKDASEFFELFTPKSIAQGYIENTCSDGMKALVDTINVAVDDVNNTINGDYAPTMTPTPTPDNPNEPVGNYNLFSEKSTTKIGEKIELSVNEVQNATYKWYLGDAQNTVIEGTHNIEATYYTADYHYPKVEIYDADGVLLGSATKDILTEYHDFELTASATTVEIGEIVTFEVNPWLERIRYIWNMGDGSTCEGATIENAYSQAGQYTVNVQLANENGVLFEDSLVITVQEPEPTPTPEPTDTETSSEQFLLTASNSNPGLGDEVFFSFVGDWNEPISWFVNDEYIGTYTIEADNQFDWKFNQAGTYEICAKAEKMQDGNFVYYNLASMTITVEDNVGLTIDYTAQKLNNGDVVYTFTASPDYTSKGYIYRWEVNNSPGWPSRMGATATWRLYSSDQEFETDVYVSVQDGSNLITSQKIPVNFTH